VTLWLVLLSAAPVVHVEIAPSCAGIDANEVRRVVSIELRLSGDGETGFATDVRAQCEGTVVSLHVEDGLSRKTLQRTVALDGVAEVARSRTLALAIVELITASWGELSLNPEPRVEPAGEAPPDTERDAARSRVRRRPALRLLLEGSGLGLIGSPFTMWGGGGRVIIEPSELWGAELDIRVDHGSAQLPEGYVTADRATAAISGTLRTHVRVVGLKALLGLRGGGVLLTSHPSGIEPVTSSAGPWLGAHLGGAASVTWGILCAELGVEVGAPLLGVQGALEGTPVGFDNFWFGGRLGIGISL
jgi:hypothetical protein